jgi:hypothetical protein
MRTSTWNVFSLNIESGQAAPSRSAFFYTDVPAARGAARGGDRTSPGVEFLYRQLKPSADFLKAYHASAHGFAPGYPAFCIEGRQVEVAIFRAGAMQRKRAGN